MHINHMSYYADLPVQKSFFNFETFRFKVVGLIFLTSCFVKLEPAPTDLLGILAIFLFAWSGVHVSKHFAAPILFLVIYIAAGYISTAVMKDLYSHAMDSSFYATGIAYTALTGLFIAAFLTKDTFNRFYMIESSYIIGGVIGAIIGILLLMRVEPLLSFFLAIPGVSWGQYEGRAVGGYKDPNVYSTWLVLPTILMAQSFIMGRRRLTLLTFTGFMLLLAGLFLAYSRGAWIDFIAAMSITIFLIMILSPTSELRIRAIIVSAIGIGVLAVGIMILLSIPTVSEMFINRFTLVKSYDAGETGRFGNQINAIPYLLTHPFGYGPHRYDQIFGQAPHNTFLNSFAAGGWIGGISYFMLFFTTCYMGFKSVFTRSPYQALAIPIFSTFFIMTLQGIQIDNEHWRHIYWMMGMVWAIYAVVKEQGVHGFTEEEIAQGWGLDSGYETEETAYATQ